MNAWGSMFSSEEENSDKKTNENAPLDTENVLSSTEITERVAEENNAPKKEVEDHTKNDKSWMESTFKSYCWKYKYSNVWYSRCLIKNKSLKKIFARYCDFGDVGISELVAAIVEHGNIEYLNVMWNSITNKGASAIATLLRVNRKLKHLNIGKNKINSNGFGLIAAAIENNFVIEEIVFANNAVERDSRIDAFLARNNRRNQ